MHPYNMKSIREKNEENAKKYLSEKQSKVEIRKETLSETEPNTKKNNLTNLKSRSKKPNVKQKKCLINNLKVENKVSPKKGISLTFRGNCNIIVEGDQYTTILKPGADITIDKDCTIVIRERCNTLEIIEIKKHSDLCDSLTLVERVLNLLDFKDFTFFADRQSFVNFITKLLRLFELKTTQGYAYLPMAIFANESVPSEEVWKAMIDTLVEKKVVVKTVKGRGYNVGLRECLKPKPTCNKE